MNLVTREIQVRALARKLMLPAVWIPVFLNFNGITLSHTLPSRLFGFAVIAIEFLELFASLMFDIVFPEMDIKYRLWFFKIFLYFDKSSGSSAFTLKSEKTSPSCADANESPVPQNMAFC